MLPSLLIGSYSPPHTSGKYPLIKCFSNLSSEGTCQGSEWFNLLPSKFYAWFNSSYDSLVAHMVKNLPAMQETWVHPWVRKIPWRRAWQPTPLFLRGESHGQRSLVGYSPWGHKVPNTTEWLTLFTFFQEWVSLLRTYTEDWSKPHLGCWTIYL